jgi:hypothetical protein
MGTRTHWDNSEMVRCVVVVVKFALNACFGASLMLCGILATHRLSLVDSLALPKRPSTR